jgi:hypothetical protein
MAPEALARLLERPVPQLQAWLEATSSVPLRIRQTLIVRVVGDYQPRAGALNILGYVPGKHPLLSGDLVIVCADLDAIDGLGGVPALDTRHLGEGAAAVLELARLYGSFSKYWTFPDRSLLFSVWSGARNDHGGLRAYLQNPTWLLDRTRAVIYVGLDPRSEQPVRELLAEKGIPLHALLADTTSSYGIQLQPSAEVRRRARSEIDWQGPDPLNVSLLLEAATVRAMALADSANALLVREAAGVETFPVVGPDALRVPNEQR